MTTAPAAETRQRLLDRMFQVRMGVFLVIVAGSALIAWAALFYRANSDVPNAMISRAIAELSDSSASVRRAAAQRLDAIPPARLADGAPALMRTLKDPDASVRTAAAGSLATSLIGYFRATDGEVPPQRDAATRALIAALGDPDPKVRAAASRALELMCYDAMLPSGRPAALGVDAKVAVPALKALLDDPAPSVAMAALRALRPLKLDPATVLPALLRLSREAPPSGRALAIAELGGVLRARKAPLDELLALLDDEGSPQARLGAARALVSPWRDPDRVALALTLGLDRAGVDERFWRTYALSTCPRVPAEAVAPLADIVAAPSADRGPYPRQLAALALAKAPPESVRPLLPALSRLARDLEDVFDPSAASAIAACAPDSAEARALVGPMTDLIRRGVDKHMQAPACEILARVRVEPKEVLPALLNAARSPDGSVREAAERALVALGPGARPLVPAMAKAAEEDISRFRCPVELLDAALTIDSESPELADALARLADASKDDRSDNLRRDARAYFAAAASQKRDVMAPLRRALESDDPKRRERACSALSIIESIPHGGEPAHAP